MANKAKLANSRLNPLETDQIPELLHELVPSLRVMNVRREVPRRGLIADLLVTVRLAKHTKTFVVELKGASASGKAIVSAGERAKALSLLWPNSYPVVVSPYLSEKQRSVLRDTGVGYADLSGNCFLEFDAVYVDRVQPTPPSSVKREQKALFTPVATRIYRTLLESPQTVWSLRELSRRSVVSIAFTQRVVQRLVKDGFVSNAGLHIVMSDPGSLLDSWANAYSFSENKVTSYRSLVRFQQIDELVGRAAEIGSKQRQKYALTMHAGASLVAPFTRFTDVHIYHDGSPRPWIRALDLVPVASGANVHLIEAYDLGVYFNSRGVRGAEVVSDIQLYLDLYNYPGRGREQADFLRKRRLSY